MRFILDEFFGDSRIFFTHNRKDYLSRDIPNAFLIRHPLYSLVSHWEYDCFMKRQKPYDGGTRGFTQFIESGWIAWQETYQDITPGHTYVTYETLLNHPGVILTALLIAWHVDRDRNKLEQIITAKRDIQAHEKIGKGFKPRNLKDCPLYHLLQPLEIPVKD